MYIRSQRTTAPPPQGRPDAAMRRHPAVLNQTSKQKRARSGGQTQHKPGRAAGDQKAVATPRSNPCGVHPKPEESTRRCAPPWQLGESPISRSFPLLPHRGWSKLRRVYLVPPVHHLDGWMQVASPPMKSGSLAIKSED